MDYAHARVLLFGWVLGSACAGVFSVTYYGLYVGGYSNTPCVGNITYTGGFVFSAC